MLNSKGEVADFWDVDQFIQGHSAYECVAYSAALIKYCGQPGQGPTGSTVEVSNVAQSWYATEEGSNDSSNMNGMSLPAMYDMLSGLQLHYQSLDATVAAVKTSLESGFPVLLCGAEAGFYDVEMGDVVPYSWPPSGNHAIVASGIASDGNLLVHDCASIAPNGVRPGPRTYDVSQMQIVSATSVAAPWQGGFMLTIQNVPTYFTAVNGSQWKCKQTGQLLGGGLLSYYCRVGSGPFYGLTLYGLPKTGEIAVPGHAGVVIQVFERAILCWDTKGVIDQVPGADSAYALHLDNQLALAQLAKYLPPVTSPTKVDLSPIVTSVKQLQTSIDADFANVLSQLGKV